MFCVTFDSISGVLGSMGTGTFGGVSVVSRFSEYVQEKAFDRGVGRRSCPDGVSFVFNTRAWVVGR